MKAARAEAWQDKTLMSSLLPPAWKVRLLPRRPHFWDLFPLVWLVCLIYPVQAFLTAPRAWESTVVFWVSLLTFVFIYARTFISE